MRPSSSITLLICLTVLAGFPCGLNADWIVVCYHPRKAPNKDEVRLLRLNDKFQLVVTNGDGDNRVERQLSKANGQQIFSALERLCFAENIPRAGEIESNGKIRTGILEIEVNGKLFRGEWPTSLLPASIDELFEQLTKQERLKR
jgi:hypothetical protein